MAQCTADQVINMMDESGSEAEDLSELESEESEIEEDPSFPLLTTCTITLTCSLFSRSRSPSRSISCHARRLISFLHSPSLVIERLASLADAQSASMAPGYLTKLDQLNAHGQGQRARVITWKLRNNSA